MLNVLLTNDDGIEAEGLQVLGIALGELADVRLVVIAPDGNRSGMARSITTSRPLWVQEADFPGGAIAAYKTDGTPVDCVRLARLGLVEGFEPDLVVSGINHGANLGDDITYSGTVAAAFEALVLGLPGIAVSQPASRDLGFRYDGVFRFEFAARFVAALVERLGDFPLPEGTLLNINVPGGTPQGVEVARIGRRIYRDQLTPDTEDRGSSSGRKYWIYGSDPGYHDEPGTDLAAVAAGRIALTPIHFDMTDHRGLSALRDLHLETLLDAVGDSQIG